MPVEIALWQIGILFLLIQIVVEAAKHYVQAYFGEKGRRAASHEDIENVLNELKVITRETERIKAEISESQWRLQSMWTERKDLYLSVFKSIGELDTWIFTVASRPISERDMLDVARLLSGLAAQLSFGTIVCGEEFRSAADRIIGARDLESPRSSNQAFVEELGHELNLLRARLVETARSDLQASRMR